MNITKSYQVQMDIMLYRNDCFAYGVKMRTNTSILLIKMNNAQFLSTLTNKIGTMALYVGKKRGYNCGIVPYYHSIVV